MNEKENDRWNTINEQFKEIEYLFMGMNTSISKLMGDEKGEITDTKIKEFLSSLLSNKDIKGKYDYNVRYYGLFLYLVCRAFDPKQRLKTIGDLMEITEEIENAYTCYDELIMHEYDGKTKGFFTEIHKSCIILTGCSLADDFSDDDYAKICEKVIQKKKAFRYLMLSEEQRNAIRDKYKKNDLNCFNESDDSDERFNEYSDFPDAKEYVTKAETWKNTFENPQEYLDAYREFSKMYFKYKGQMQYFILHDINDFSVSQNKIDNFSNLYAELDRIIHLFKSKFK